MGLSRTKSAFRCQITRIADSSLDFFFFRKRRYVKSVKSCGQIANNERLTRLENTYSQKNYVQPLSELTPRYRFVVEGSIGVKRVFDIKN